MPLTPFSKSNESSELEHAVRKYYDHNTKMFLKHGEHGDTFGIHQPLYLNQGDSTEAAMHAHHHMIVNALGDTHNSVTHILDLGCGVGSSVAFLANNTSKHVHFTGISISSEQIDQAQKITASSANSDRISFQCASFQDLPIEISNIDLAYSIEGFIHSPDASVFFQQVGNALKPGGKLILFDDFLLRAATTKKEERILGDFRSGWKANSIYTVTQLDNISREAGFVFVNDDDVTGFLRLNRPRDKAIAVLSSLLRHVPSLGIYQRFLLGGNARQQGFKHGLLSYRMLVFQKV